MDVLISKLLNNSRNQGNHKGSSQVKGNGRVVPSVCVLSHSKSKDKGMKSSQPAPSKKTCSTAGISEITDFLYLSGAFPITPSTLEYLGITCVINAAAELPDTPLPDTPIEYFKLGVRDTANEDLLYFFDLVADLIHQTDCVQGKTLVHCVAGVSRSAALCLAYLVKYQKLTLKEAYTLLKEKRPAIKPNVGFFEQLIGYEREFFEENSVKMVFNEMLSTRIPDVYHEEYQALKKMREQYRSVK